MARAALERAGDLPHLLHVRLAAYGLGQRQRLLIGVVERDVQGEVRHQLRDAVHVAVRHAEHAADVADRRLRAERPERDDVRDPVAAVAFGHVTDDLVAPVVREVDVHIGHRDPLGVQESLEEQSVTYGIDVRDGQAVRGQRAGGRAASRADGDPLLAGVADEVPDDQEVAREAHLLDDGELVGEPRLDGVTGIRSVPALEPRVGQFVQIAVERVLAGYDVARQVELVELEREVAALGDRERVGAGLGELGEDARHLFGRLDVELLRREPEAPGVLQIRPGLDAQERLVGARVAVLEVVRVVRADDRSADRLRDAQGLGHDPFLLRDAVGLDLHEVVVLAEDLLVPPGCLARAYGVAGAEHPRHLGVQTTREYEQPVGVLREQLAIDARLVVEALQERPGHQLDEVLVPRAIADEHRQVVGTFVAAVLRAPLLAAARRDVELAAEDRLDPGLLRGEIEVDRAEEVAVIGQGDRGELELLGLVDQLLELGGAVEQAVLGMHVQVDEFAVLHRAPGHSHSIVEGGLDEMSNTTRLMPFTSLMMRLLMVPSRS